MNANTWTTLEFTLPTEVCTNHSAGNSVLATGKGVLEHLAIVPNGGMGVYTMHLDNFEMVWTPALPSAISMNANATLTYTASATDPDPGSGLNFGLDADAPAGSFNIVTYVNDQPTNGAAQKTTSATFGVTVTADPLGVQSAVNAGETVALTWDSVPGTSYQVQSKSEGSNWTNDGPSVTATGTTSSLQVTNSGGAKQYRVVELGGGSSQ